VTKASQIFLGTFRAKERERRDKNAGADKNQNYGVLSKIGPHQPSPFFSVGEKSASLRHVEQGNGENYADSGNKNYLVAQSVCYHPIPISMEKGP